MYPFLKKNTPPLNWGAGPAGGGGAAAVLPARAQAQPDGTVEITIFRAGFIVGGGGGNGILHFQGKGYNLSVGGVSLGATIGVARVEYVGEVQNLKNVKDIEGTYTAVTASAAAAGGAAITDLQNSRGVRLRLQGRQIGLMVSVDLSGMQLSLRN